MIGRAVVAAAAATLLTACSGTSAPDAPDAGRAPGRTSSSPRTDQPSGRPSPSPSASASASGSRSTTTPRASRTTQPADPRWRFYTDDHHWYRSPWFAGRHQVMVPFGCTAAPYYDADPACPDGHGKHHGIDVAMPCGTPLLAARPATVLDHSALGPAYGVDPVLLRVGDQDVVIGHTVHVFVQPGDRLAAGERFALAGDSGAPDGCHLHFEVRPEGGDYTDAVDPRPLLRLTVAGAP